MTKSEFYILWYQNRGYELSDNGYPMVTFNKFADDANDDPNYIPTAEELDPENHKVMTEADWNKFLETEVEVSDLCRHSEEACEIVGIEYQMPYEQARIYPDIGNQLDNIYKSLKALKDSGIDLGVEGNSYVNSITNIKESTPKN